MKHKKPLALILSLITALTLSIPVIAQEGNIPDKIINLDAFNKKFYEMMSKMR